jgi:hypothetical protein
LVAEEMKIFNIDEIKDIELKIRAFLNNKINLRIKSHQNIHMEDEKYEEKDTIRVY